MQSPSVRFYNTLTQKLEPFDVRTPGEARIYLCGLTPQDYAHAGHARTLTVFDVLVRHLRGRGYKVTYVRNVTDVDDKILRRSSERGEDPLVFSRRMAALAQADLDAIGCVPPDVEPRVSDHVAEIIALVERLIERGHAYSARTDKGQDVYFAVRSFAEYGKLSHRNIDDLLAGARIEVGEAKKDPLDFALWKGCGEQEWGWPSPWGKGRPGWHIECSAMAQKYLGAHLDIHGGGMDLIFPHHENEIAQSEGAWGSPFSRYWLHAGFLTVDQEKMSKSLGNFVTIRDVLARNDAEALRYFVLGTHYRGPLAFDVERLDGGRVVFPGVDEAERRVDYLYATRELLRVAADGASPRSAGALKAQARVVAQAPDKVLDALDKDLNTPVALAALGELAKTANEIATQAAKGSKDASVREATQGLAAAALDAFDQCCAPLGLLQASAAEFAGRTRERRLALRGLDAAQIEDKVKARTEARAQKNFARADALRTDLVAIGIELFDSAGGSTWKVVI